MHRKKDLQRERSIESLSLKLKTFIESLLQNKR